MNLVLQIARRSGGWGWFFVWALPGSAAALGTVSLGPLLLLPVALLGVLLWTRPRVRRSAFGLLTGGHFSSTWRGCSEMVPARPAGIPRPVGFVNSVAPDLQASCRSRKASRAARVTVVRPTTAAPPFSLIVSSDTQGPPSGFRSRAESLLGRARQQRRGGRPFALFRHPARTEKSLEPAGTRRNRSPLAGAMPSRGRKAGEATGSRFPWKSAMAEFANPTGFKIPVRQAAPTVVLV
jgi:hypothetical protein